MKCLQLIFASLSLLLSFSLCSPVKFENFGSDILGMIADYLNDPAGSLGSVNTYGRKCFTELYPSKHFFSKRFQIPELESIDENEPELRYLLSLSPFSSDPLHVFYGVLDQIDRKKKPYDLLYVPLLSYLSRVFKTLPSDAQHRIIVEERPSFNDYLIRYHESKGDFKSSFEAVTQSTFGAVHRNAVSSWFNERKYNTEIYKMFLTNPQAMELFKDVCRNSSVMRIYWIFNCILLDAPEDYYTDFLIQDPYVITGIVSNLYDVLKNITEIQHSSIHNRLKSHFDRFYNLLADVHFGHEIKLLYGCVKRMFAKFAVVENKIEVFQQILNTENDKWSFIESLIQCSNSGTMEKLLITFAGLKCSSQKERDAFFSNPHKLLLISKYYALGNIYVSNDKLFVELIAPSSLPSSCPHLVTFALPANVETYCILFANEGFGSIWSEMKVINEDTLYSFLISYDQISDLAPYKIFNTSVEVIKLIISSPVLIDKISNMRLMLCLSESNDENKVDIILEFLDSIEDAKTLSSIISLGKLQNQFITYLRTESQLKKFEDFTNLSIADIFLSQNSPMTEYDYFKWRLVLGYWIKSDRRQDIAQITSPVIIKLLRIEFYDDMLELLGRETLENVA